jgi:hypothetical protein
VLLLALAVLALILYLSYRWVMRHPEQVKGAFERLGGAASTLSWRAR